MTGKHRQHQPGVADRARHWARDKMRRLARDKERVPEPGDLLIPEAPEPSSRSRLDQASVVDPKQDRSK